jgi:O-antigen ligase
MNFIKRYDLTSRAIIVLISVVLSIVIITASVMFGAEILALLGRDTTLTGRTDIWQAVWQSILKRPMLGYGFAGFWIGMKGEAINVIASVLWDVPHAHNGFLEIMLQLGVIGMAIFILSYLRACSRAWTMIRSQYIEQAIWPIFALFLILICNLDENTLLSFNGIFWVIYIVALVNLELMVPLVAQVPVRRVATLWAVRE